VPKGQFSEHLPNMKSLHNQAFEELYRSNDANGYLISLDRPMSHLTYKDLSNKQRLLQHSIQLFSDIFSQNNVTQKNKLSLLKHFLAHVQPAKDSKEKEQTSKKGQKVSSRVDPKESPEKESKVAAIAMTLALVARHMMKKGQELEPSQGELCL
jgi:hypothetical protein